MSSNTPPHDLSQAFGFSADDLAANRAGHLTPAQHKQLDDYHRIRGVGGQCSLLAVLGSLLVILGVAVVGGFFQSDRATLKQAIPAFLIGLTLFVSIFLIAYAYGWWSEKDFRARKIRVVEGRAELAEKVSGEMMGYYLKIGKTRFQLETAARYAALENGSSYRVYYIKRPPAHIILSTEALTPG